MDISYFTQCFADYPTQKKRSYEISYDIIESTFGRCVNDVLEFQRTDLVLSLFQETESHGGCKSAASFMKRKACVLDFYKWLSTQTSGCSVIISFVSGLSWDDVMNDMSQYAQSLAEFLARVDTVAYLSSTQDFPSQDQCRKRYIGLKCLIVLLWNGLSCDECATLRKSDIDRKNRSILVGNRRLPLDSLSFNTVNEYANSYEFVDRAGRTLQLVDSEFIFRTKRKPSVNRYDLWGFVKNYNDDINEINRRMETQTGLRHRPERINISAIERNGILDRVFSEAQQTDCISESELLSIISKHAACDVANATRFRDLYHRWLEYFFN